MAAEKLPVDHDNYIRQIEEASALARRIVANNPLSEFMDAFHCAMNLNLTLEERLYNGVIKHTYIKCFQTSN